MLRLRAEWEPQNVVLIAFPHEATDWAKEGDLQKAYAPFVRIAQAIAYSQTVYILCKEREPIADLFSPGTTWSSSKRSITTHGPGTTGR